MNDMIAFQGVEGANADLACRMHYPYMKTKAYAAFDDVFDAVAKGEAKLGLIPIENSHAGRVAETHQILPRSDTYIVGEHFLKIEHHLVGVKGASLTDIKTVYSHPQALMQCRNHIRELGLHTETHSNTALAAADIAKWGDKTKAALCSKLAAELYGLTVIKENMQDADDNMTAFIAIARDMCEMPENKDNTLTSILFMVRNIPAALYKALGGFATNNVNIVKLESYIPGGVSSSARFFITFEGSPEDRSVQLALEELGFFSRKVQVLGVYEADPIRKSAQPLGELA